MSQISYLILAKRRLVAESGMAEQWLMLNIRPEVIAQARVKRLNWKFMDRAVTRLFSLA